MEKTEIVSLVMELTGIISNAEQIISRRNIAPAELLPKQAHIRKMMNTSSLRIGLAGGFNTGKSTLVNAFIGSNIVPMGSDQGTTAIPLHISASNQYDFVIHYVNGKKESYSRSRQKMMRKYMPQAYENVGWTNRKVAMINDLLGNNEIDESFFTLLSSICTIDDEAVESVHLKCPTTILKENIELVDLPAFDSFIYDSYRQRAFRKLHDCDIVIVTVSPQKMLNEDLIEFFESGCLSVKRLVFAITMADAVACVELERLLKDLKQQLSERLSINNATVVPCPSLLYLVRRGILESNIDFSKNPGRELQDLMNAFHLFKEQFFGEIGANIEKIKCNNAAIQEYEVFSVIEKKQERAVKELADEIRELANSQTMPLDSFLTSFREYNYQQDIDQYEKQYVEDFEIIRESFVRTMSEALKNASTKNEAQHIFTCDSVKEKNDMCSKELYQSYLRYIDALLNLYNSKREELVRGFLHQYNIKPLLTINGCKISPIECVGSKIRYSKRKLTTFVFARMFKRLKTIKQQVYDILDDVADRTLKKTTTNYQRSKTTANLRFRRQYEKMISKIYSDNIDVISRRIDNEDEVLQNKSYVYENLNNELDYIVNTIKNLKIEIDYDSIYVNNTFVRTLC